MKKILIFFTITIMNLNIFAEENKKTEANASAPIEEKKEETSKDHDPKMKNEYHFSLGAGYALKTNIRKDNTYKNSSDKTVGQVIPMAQIFIGPVQIGAGGLTLNLFGKPFLGTYFNVSQMGDNYYATGMENRKESWGAGLGARIFGFQLQVNKDINGKSKGYKGQISYGKPYFFDENLLIRFGVSLEILDQNFMDYYYGVKASEVTSSRSFYAPGGASNVSLSAFPIYKYNEDINMMAGYSLKFLNKKIQDSPTTNGKKLEHALIFGVTYKIK